MKRRSLTDRACRLLAFGAIGAALVLQYRDVAASDSDFFKEKVAPIFERNCMMCHGARVQRSRLDLRSEEAILKGGARGPAVVPGDAEKSLLYRLITRKEEPAMPRGMDRLGDAEIAVIAQWINELSSSRLSAPQPSAKAVAAKDVAVKAVTVAETIPTRQLGYSITEKD